MLQDQTSTPADVRLSSSNDKNLPPFTGCIPDRRDRSHSPSGTSPRPRNLHTSQSHGPCSSAHSQAQKPQVPQPYHPQYHCYSHSSPCLLAYSYSRSNSHSPFEQHSRAEPHRAARNYTDYHRSAYRDSRSCSVSPRQHLWHAQCHRRYRPASFCLDHQC